MKTGITLSFIVATPEQAQELSNAYLTLVGTEDGTDVVASPKKGKAALKAAAPKKGKSKPVVDDDEEGSDDEGDDGDYSFDDEEGSDDEGDEDGSDEEGSDDEGDEDGDDEEPAPKKGKAAPAASGKLKLTDVVAAFQETHKRVEKKLKSKDKAVAKLNAVLKKHGAKSTRTLDPKKYATVVKELKAL